MQEHRARRVVGFPGRAAGFAMFDDVSGRDLADAGELCEFGPCGAVGVDAEGGGLDGGSCGGRRGRAARWAGESEQERGGGEERDEGGGAVMAAEGLGALVVAAGGDGCGGLAVHGAIMTPGRGEAQRGRDIANFFVNDRGGGVSQRAGRMYRRAAEWEPLV